MTEISSFFLHPAIGFFALALVLPFLPGRRPSKIPGFSKPGDDRSWWRWLLPLPAVLAIVAVFTYEPGNYGGFEYLGLKLQLGRLDRLSLIFANVFAIQALIGFIYAFHVRDKRLHMAACFYVGGAFGCVFSGDYLSLFIFWEIMSIASTMLIWLNSRENGRAPGAGLRYFLVHTLGGLLLLGGVLLRYKALGHFDFEHVGFEGARYYDWLIMFGFGVNAAFVALHAWLPDAYPEATITGAVFMSAFTTKTAVYVLARGFAGWDFLAYMGTAMALYGVLYASMENNARRILSYHIMSQVGYMVAGIGIGTALTMNGATAHAYAHILYKGLLFMSVGAILHSAGTASLEKLGGLAGRLPLVMLAYMVAGLSISGMPIFNGFVSKTMTIAGAFEDHHVILGILLEVAAVGTFLSVGLKLPYFAFWGGKPEDTTRMLKPIPGNMYLAMGLASAMCILQGLFPQMLYVFLPFQPVDYVPWTPWHVLQTLLLLGFTGLGFMLMRKVLKPHAQRNVDFEFLYMLIGRGFVALVSRPMAFFDSLWSEAWRVLGLRGLMDGAKGASIFDRKGIDTVVDGAAYTTRALGFVSARMQTGRLQDYLAGAVAIGVAAMILVWILR
ncbi:MAG: Na(+)/H(+) antiporter subunit D [Desulfocurvibacter africanus]